MNVMLLLFILLMLLLALSVILRMLLQLGVDLIFKMAMVLCHFFLRGQAMAV